MTQISGVNATAPMLLLHDLNKLIFLTNYKQMCLKVITYRLYMVIDPAVDAAE